MRFPSTPRAKRLELVPGTGRASLPAARRPLDPGARAPQVDRNPGLVPLAQAEGPLELGPGAALFRGQLGRPSREEAFQAAAAALRGVSWEGLTDALAQAGFEPALDDALAPDRRRFRAGGFELTVDRASVGLEPALLVSLADKLAKKKDRQGVEAVAMGPAILPRETFEGIRERYTEEMQRFFEGLKGLPETADLPTSLDALKALGAAGQSAQKQKKEAAEAAEIAEATAALTASLSALKAAGQAPKGIIVYVEGPDGAGKTSTGAIVMQALEDAGYKPRGEVFKAPTEAERKQHWLERFERGVPKKGEVVFWDRGPSGDAVYGKPSAAKKAQMGQEFQAFEEKLAEDGVLMFKLELYASQEKQAETFGKRLARQAMAHQIGGALTARGGMTEAQRQDLALIAGKIDADDFRALETYPDVQAGFLSFVEQSGPKSWNVVDATKRHAARLEIIERFEQALGAFGAQRAVKAA